MLKVKGELICLLRSGDDVRSRDPRCFCAPFGAVAALEVNYPQSRVAAAPGSSLRLLCHVTYDVAQCGQLRAAWYQSGSPSDVELTDPSRYVTTVNETEDGARRRRVMTEIVHVTPRDEGRFQCKAECKDGGAVGHFIQVTVGG